jgi:hypothetical protein
MEQMLATFDLWFERPEGAVLISARYQSQRVLSKVRHIPPEDGLNIFPSSPWTNRAITRIRELAAKTQVLPFPKHVLLKEGYTQTPPSSMTPPATNIKTEISRLSSRQSDIFPEFPSIGKTRRTYATESIDSIPYQISFVCPSNMANHCPNVPLFRPSTQIETDEG